jgi:hypothetical protein
MTAEVAVNVEIGPDEAGTARQIGDVWNGSHDGYGSSRRRKPPLKVASPFGNVKYIVQHKDSMG